MEMHQVRYFLALSETLNFTRAAEKCHVTQPSLTRAIKMLEDELGGPLFHRRHNGTCLSELGRLMLPHLEEVYGRAEAAKSRAQAYVKLAEAPLTLGIMCTIGPMTLVDLLRRYQKANPGVELFLRDAKAQALQQMLLDGELDVAIYGLPEGVDERLHAIELFRERVVVAVAPGHRFERQNAVRLTDLRGERYLVRVTCEFGDHMTELMRAHGVEPERPYFTERDDWIQSMILAGIGYGFFPERAVSEPGLVVRPLVDPEVFRTVYLVTARGRPHSPAVGALVREARNHRWARPELDELPAVAFSPGLAPTAGS